MWYLLCRYIQFVCERPYDGVAMLGADAFGCRLIVDYHDTVAHTILDKIWLLIKRCYFNLHK